MTSLLIGLCVWPTISAAQESPKDVMASERAMRKHCAGVDEALIRQIQDHAIKMPGASHGALISEMRGLVKREKLAVSDACLAEITRLAYASNVKDEKARQEAEAEATRVAKWNALSEAEQSWVRRAKGRVPALTCDNLALGAIGVLSKPVNVRHVDDRNGGFIIGELECNPIVTTVEVKHAYSGGGGGTPRLRNAREFQFGQGAPGSVVGEPQTAKNIVSTETVTTPRNINIWLSSVDVNGLTTGAKLDWSKKGFEVVGTRASVDELGGGTIFEVRAIPVDPTALAKIVPPSIGP